jgi:hypothetical protein
LRGSYCRDSLSFLYSSLFRRGNVGTYLDTCIPVGCHHEVQAVMMCSMGPLSAVTRADIHTMLYTPSTRVLLLSAMQVKP